MSLTWKSASGGNVPSGAKAAGKDTNGDALYVARQSIPGSGLQLGKVRPGLGSALIPYGGQELSIESYEVLMNPTTYPNGYNPPGPNGAAWTGELGINVPTSSEKESKGFVPPNFSGKLTYALSSDSSENTPGNQLLEFHAIKCGEEQDGTPLFAALVDYQGTQPGKVSLAMGGANIGYGGVEIAGQNPYSVLCDASTGFVNGSPDGVPNNSTAYGVDDDGCQLYIARSTGQLPGLQLGKVRADGWNGGGCSISYGGKEVAVKQYQVMFDPKDETANPKSSAFATFFGGGNWVQANNGAIPDGALVLGCDDDGTPLFAAQSLPGTVGSGIQLGKIRHGFQGAYFPYNGNEVVQTEYYVLCAT
jgi:hypothetical protein